MAKERIYTDEGFIEVQSGNSLVAIKAVKVDSTEPVATQSYESDTTFHQFTSSSELRRIIQMLENADTVAFWPEMDEERPRRRGYIRN